MCGEIRGKSPILVDQQKQNQEIKTRSFDSELHFVTLYLDCLSLYLTILIASNSDFISCSCEFTIPHFLHL